jgi:hypothetical protein
MASGFLTSYQVSSCHSTNPPWGIGRCGRTPSGDAPGGVAEEAAGLSAEDAAEDADEDADEDAAGAAFEAAAGVRAGDPVVDFLKTLRPSVLSFAVYFRSTMRLTQRP